MYATFHLSDLLNQALVYTTMSNTTIQKNSATPIRAKTNTSLGRWHEKKTSQFSFFQNQCLKCSYSPLSILKTTFTIAKFLMHDIFTIIEEFYLCLVQDLQDLFNIIKR